MKDPVVDEIKRIERYKATIAAWESAVEGDPCASCGAVVVSLHCGSCGHLIPTPRCWAIDCYLGVFWAKKELAGLNRLSKGLPEA